MGVHTQKAAVTVDTAPRCLTHARRGPRRSRHFTHFLTCRTTPQKIQASTHSAAKSSYPSWFRKHPHVHMAAEMARSPAAPGLLFTAAAVHGFSAVSEVARNLADKGSIRAEALGADITRQLQQASDDISIQTESSQTAFQEWKGLMSGILSEEASKLQADLDHASRAAAAWQQQSSEVLAQIQDGISSRPNLNSHPLGLPSMKLPELQSGWLADAIQERWAEAGSSSAWPTSFSVAMGSDSSSDSMSVSDDEDAKAGSLPSFMSRFTDQARDVTAQLQDSSDRGRTFLDKKGSELGSAASDFATSVYSKVVQFPGQGFGVSNFSPPGTPGRFPGKMGQTGPSSSRQLPKPASSTGLLPSPAKAKALPTTTPSPPAALSAPSASPTAAALPPPGKPTAALPLPPSATAAALPSPSAADAASPHMTSPARKAVTQKGGVLSPRSAIRKAMRTSSAVVPLVRTSNSRQSMTKASPSGKPPAVKTADESSAGINQSSSTASLPAGHSPSSSSGPSAAGQHTSSASATQSPAGSAVPNHLPSSASPSQCPALSSAVPAASSSPTVPVAAASHSGKPPAAEGRGLPLGTANNAEPSASTASTASGLSLSAAAEEQGFSSPSANNATATVDSVGDAHQARGDAHQVKGGAHHAKEGAFWAKVGALWARGDAHQTKGDAHQARADAHLAKQQVPQAREAGGQQMPGAEEPKAVGNETKSQVHPAEQHRSSTDSMQAQLPSSESDTAASKLPDQAQEQPKTPRLKHVRVVRPEPTPNWRTRRPLTPPPAPVQQGHPLSASPAHVLPLQTPAAGSAGSSQVEHAAPQPATNSASDTTDQSSTVRQVTTAAAAATAVDSSTTTVVDSIPWGTSGTATTRSRQGGMPGSPQAGGGGGSITGGSTGGSGGGSPRSSGDSGGEDDGSRSSSTWGQWWLKLLLVGGGATAVGMRSTARTAIWDAVSAVRTRFASGRTGEHHQEEEVQEEEQELLQQAEEEEVQAEPAALSTDQEEGIATNIKVKEGDTAWSLAEEYSGTGQAWPEVVSSNPHANMAKPGAGMSVRVSVRMGN